MRVLFLLSCLLAAAVAVYPEAPVTSAARATEPSRTAAISTEPALITQSMVEGWLKNWSRRLGLTEWKLEARIVRLSQLPKGTVANIHWSLPRRTATIKVLDAVDSTLPASEVARDTELSVVHELVHLSMAKLPLDGNDTELEEEAVKKLSSALLDLDLQARNSAETRP